MAAAAGLSDTAALRVMRPVHPRFNDIPTSHHSSIPGSAGVPPARCVATISPNPPTRRQRSQAEWDFRFAIGGFIGYLANMTMAENKFLKEAIKQGLRMQHRFLAEPVLARTGKGYMKSEGVATLQRIKAGMKKSRSA
jgi:hypothetical protein